MNHSFQHSVTLYDIIPQRKSSFLGVNRMENDLEEEGKKNPKARHKAMLNELICSRYM